MLLVSARQNKGNDYPAIYLIGVVNGNTVSSVPTMPRTLWVRINDDAHQYVSWYCISAGDMSLTAGIWALGLYRDTWLHWGICDGSTCVIIFP